MTHIVATITFSEAIERTRTDGGVMTGYSPHHKFDRVGFLCSGRHDYGDVDYHFVGETILAEISFLTGTT